MANLIQKAKRKTPELIAIKWDGLEETVPEIKTLLAKHGIGVFYIGPDDWHHTLTPDESFSGWYYAPYLVIQSERRRDIRFEKELYMVINPEASSLEPKVTIMSEEELRKTHELYGTKEEVDDDQAPNDDQAEGSDYRAVEDLAGHGDGELRERDALGGESGTVDNVS